MTLQVSSWFAETLKNQTLALSRHFIVGSEDLSSRVLRWPTLHAKTDTIHMGGVRIAMDNMDGGLQYLVDCNQIWSMPCQISVGLTHPDSNQEQVALYNGQPSGVSFQQGGLVAQLQLQDKTARLSDIRLGGDTAADNLSYENSAYLPSDLAWSLLTQHGGFSSLANSANPDIQYQNWVAWNEENTIRQPRVKGLFRGETLYQAIETLARMDGMTIYFQNNRLDFAPIVPPFEKKGEILTRDDLIEFQMSLDLASVINEYSVEVNYSTGTNQFLLKHTQVNSRSQQIFGEKSGRFGSRMIWFSALEDSRYMAEDTVRFKSSPSPQATLRAPLGRGLVFTVGDIVSIQDSVFPLTGNLMRVIEMSLNLENAEVEMGLARADQRPWNHQETVAAENLLLTTFRRWGVNKFVAVDEKTPYNRAFTTDSAGVFHPVNAYGSTVCPLNQTEMLVAGFPSSGYLYTYIQRSSNEGNTFTVVHSMAPGIYGTYDFFEVVSGTLLLGVSSGGIYRSTDAGSSWNHTWTISGEYHIERFFQPYSGTIWGGTGYNNFGAANGAYIWESVNGGVSWSQKHTVNGSGTIKIVGLAHTGDGEYLAGILGTSDLSRMVYRSKFSSPTSSNWTKVISGSAFANVVLTDSGHLLLGSYDFNIGPGGFTYRSLDFGSSWVEDARISKQGNIAIFANSDGTADAYSMRIAYGQARTDRYRNYDPNRID